MPLDNYLPGNSRARAKALPLSCPIQQTIQSPAPHKLISFTPTLLHKPPHSHTQHNPPPPTSTHRIQRNPPRPHHRRHLTFHTPNFSSSQPHHLQNKPTLASAQQTVAFPHHDQSTCSLLLHLPPPPNNAIPIRFTTSTYHYGDTPPLQPWDHLLRHLTSTSHHPTHTTSITRRHRPIFDQTIPKQG